MTATIEKVWNIDQIQGITEPEAQEMALDAMEIKGHHVYFVDFGGYFKYSALVFADGMHIYYANEYELHHEYAKLDHEGLKAKYIDCLSGKLFTEDEITAPIADYGEYQRREYFLHNYYGMRREHTSCFFIQANAKQREEYNRGRAKHPHLNPVCFAYYADKPFVQRCVALHVALQKAWRERENDFEVMKKAFIREMYDHEYCINYQADFDTLSAFGNIEWKHGDYTEALNSYFDQLHFTDTQRKAYFEARKEYYRQINEPEE